MVDPSSPHTFWQTIDPPGTHDCDPATGFGSSFPVQLPDSRELLLPIRALSDGQHGLASLIVNQASFVVIDALAALLAERVRAISPELVVALPTLGITLGEAVARHLGHSRFVPLGTSRKFWYDETLSEPMRSITSPGAPKQLYLDPRMQPLLDGARVLLIDDVLSTGTSIKAACRLLQKVGVVPCAIGAAMLQTRRWVEPLRELDPQLPDRVTGVFETPRLQATDQGRWRRA